MTSRASSHDDASAKDAAPCDGTPGCTMAPVKDEALARLQHGEALLVTLRKTASGFTAVDLYYLAS